MCLRGGIVLLGLLSFVPAICVAQTKPANPSTRNAATNSQFADEMQKLLDSWTQEFNAAHPDKVLEFYAPKAELLRGDGTVHDRVSIHAELQHWLDRGAHDFVFHSLRSEQSGDLGYDTGAFNAAMKDHDVEGNYLIVVKRIAGQWKIVAHASIPNPRMKF